MNNKETWVENLLAATPLEVADDGFSERVMANIRAREKQRLMVLAPFYVAGIASFLAFFPYQVFEGLATGWAGISPAMISGFAPVLAVLGMVILVTFSEEAR